MQGIIERSPIYGTLPASMVPVYEEATEQGHFGLHPDEIFWRDIQPFLNRRGYTLRDRYKADWKPSWIGTNKDPSFCEDSISTFRHHFIDAQIAGKETRVGIKKVIGHPDEVEIVRFLVSANLWTDPRNHCVEILDVFCHPSWPDITFVVMPLLRPFDSPPFLFLGEVVEFVRQTLEGLCFMHEIHIAHRDCSGMNIMMDGATIYPQGFHPMRFDWTADAKYKLPHVSRLNKPVKYYFIDFSLSSYFPGDISPYVVGDKGRDRDIPDLSESVPYNAYKLDVHILGNTFRTEFLLKYQGAECLELLVGAMTEINPEKRATAAEALALFEGIALNVTKYHQQNDRLLPVEPNVPKRIVRDTVEVARSTFKRLTRMGQASPSSPPPQNADSNTPQSR